MYLADYTNGKKSKSKKRDKNVSVCWWCFSFCFFSWFIDSIWFIDFVCQQKTSTPTPPYYNTILLPCDELAFNFIHKWMSHTIWSIEKHVCWIKMEKSKQNWLVQRSCQTHVLLFSLSSSHSFSLLSLFPL